MPVNIDGTAGVTTPGLASTAMPTSGGDPIVESGSNTDGGWTRWADGTQSVTTVHNLSFIDVTKIGINRPPFPQPFVSIPVLSGVRTSGSDDFAPVDTDIGCTQMYLPTATDWGIIAVFRVTGTTTFQSGDTSVLSAAAIGRWK